MVAPRAQSLRWRGGPEAAAGRQRAILRAAPRGEHALIFISHSCKDALLKHPPAGHDAVQLARLGFARDLRDALAQRLGAFTTVWFDRVRLQPGDEWEAEIVTALHGCQGAVLLLTPDALKSPWVLREATVLADRRGRWPGLCLVPVLCAGLDHRSLAADQYWKALNVARWQPVQAVRCAFECADAALYLQDIVNAVGARMQGLADPVDTRHAGWTQDLRAFIGELARLDLTVRLQDAARAVGLKPPADWTGDAPRELARMLLQTGAMEPVDGGPPRYPLLEALARLIPGDPAKTPRNADEKKFCGLLRPLAAPPAVAVAVADAGSGAAGHAAPVLLRTGDWHVAELAALRASCNRAWVRPLSGVGGEGGMPLPADLKAAGQQVRKARMMGEDCYIVATLQPLAGEDPVAMVRDLGQALPAEAKLVAALDRSLPTADGVIDVPEDDELAAIDVADVIDQYSGDS